LIIDLNLIMQFTRNNHDFVQFQVRTVSYYIKIIREKKKDIRDRFYFKVLDNSHNTKSKKK
jgi:hypothetical protein